MTRILHVVSDHPASGTKGSTEAVPLLIESTAGDFYHVVVAIRRSGFFRVRVESADENLIVLTVPRFPFGAFSNASLWMGYYVLKRRGVFAHRLVDVIHAHKLTIDGVLGLMLSRYLRRPMIVSVRGDTDVRFARFKYFSRWIYKYVYRSSSFVFWVSKWARIDLRKYLSVDVESGTGLPNICDTSGTAISPKRFNGRFVFVGKLSSYKKKGLKNILVALSQLKEHGFTMDIYGGGTDKEVARVLRDVRGLGLHRSVRYCGKLKHSELMLALSDYDCLLYPSVDETFGMAYVEALFKGLVLVKCAASGISDYVTAPYIIELKDQRVHSISLALIEVSRNYRRYFETLSRDLTAGNLDVFKQEAIARKYKEVVFRILDTPVDAAGALCGQEGCRDESD